MLNLPETFVIFDMEWTAWEGSRERQWSGPGEQREVYDIGAILVNGISLEVIDTFHRYVKLELTPTLPEYSINLTGITQENLDTEGVLFKEAVEQFKTFCKEYIVYAWGSDGDVLAENCTLKDIPNPFLQEQFKDIREIFKEKGIPTEKYQSSTIGEYFGITNPHRIHQGVNDALSILSALQALQEHS